ncbi:MAG: U32 family peptidase [Ruminococcus sp.]|nr:U32 family peptidase [Ruminococcus sp.]
MSKAPELLSPAGDFESLRAALAYGADAVYLAGKQFGMRSAPKNFDQNQLKEACLLAHGMGRRVYMTCNILPRNDELSALPDFLCYAQECGVDAFIIADLGILDMAKQYAPKVARHISTQAGVTNYAAANALHQLGASRVVLARELPLTEIAEIRAHIPDELEIECFVHGAMCVSFSGRCLISSYLTGRDANHGDCAQPCRWKYHLFEETRDGQFFPVEEDNTGTYLYNSRDMCMIEHIPEMVQAGISSFKIEGRAKSAYYTAVTTNAYRHAIDDFCTMGEAYQLQPWIREELEKISHRAYSTGFYFGHEPGQAVHSGGYIRHYNQCAVCEEQRSDTTAIITQRNRFFVGDTLDVLPPSGIPLLVRCLSLTNEAGERVDSAPHPMERLLIETDRPIPAGSVLRIKTA